MTMKVQRKKDLDLLVQLRDALKKRNKKQAKRLLLKNTIFDGAKRKSAHTLIHWAILKFEDVEILKILIDQGANVCAKNYRGQTPLNMAIQHEHFKAIKLLLNNKAYDGENFKELLEAAINNKSEKLVKLLVDCGAKNKLFKNLNDLLNLAITKELAKIVKLIIPYCRFKNANKHVSDIAVLVSDPKFSECLNILLQHGFKMESGWEKNNIFVFNAVQNGYLTILKRLLSLGVNVDMVSETTGLSLLHTACFYKQHKVAELLLKNRANVNCKVKRGTIIWHRSSFAEKLKTLLGKTPLFIAVNSANVKLLDIILSHGATIPYNTEFMDLISRAVRYDRLEMLKVFIQHGFNVNAITTNGKTLLHDCAKYETQLIHIYTTQTLRCNHTIKCQIVELFLKNGANINAHGPDGETPLFIAINENYSNMVDFLLQQNANVNHKNVDGNTPLHVAAKGSWVSACIVTRLVECKTNVNEPNLLGSTPFHFACKNWSANLIQMLIDHGAEINLEDPHGQKPIHFAAEGQDIEVIGLLLKNGACAADTDYNDRTPLHILCSQFAEPNVETLRLFLRYGADINAADIYDKTPLTYACKRGHLKTVKMLLAHHARVNRIDIYGLTPVHVAAECSEKVARYLMGRKTTITDFLTREGKSLLHSFIEDRNVNIIKEYINILNVHFDTPDKCGKTPLFHAAAAARERIVTVLLKHGADINTYNNQYPTVPMYIYSRMIKINRELINIMQELRRNPNEIENYSRLRSRYLPYWRKMGHYKRIMHLLRKHIIMLKAARMRLHPKNVRFSINDHTNTDLYVDERETIYFAGYESLCKAEVTRLQAATIVGTDLSLYDILTRDTDILAKHCSLDKIKPFLKNDNLMRYFPIYIDFIRHRFTSALRRKKLLMVAHHYTESSIFFGLPAICTNKIFNYINNNEIKNFNNAVGVVKYFNQTEKDDLKILLKTDSAQFLRELKPTETDVAGPSKRIKRY